MAQYNRPIASVTAWRWQDRINLVLAIWLFISPWVLSFGAAVGPVPGAPAATPTATAMIGNASWNAWVCGVVIAVIALSGLRLVTPWQAWLTLVLGIWLFIAPWVLGFASAANAAWDHWIIGVLVFLASVWELTEARRLAAVDYAHAGEKPRDRP
jgi:hypothetical protein